MVSEIVGYQDLLKGTPLENTPTLNGLYGTNNKSSLISTLDKNIFEPAYRENQLARLTEPKVTSSAISGKELGISLLGSAITNADTMKGISDLFNGSSINSADVAKKAVESTDLNAVSNSPLKGANVAARGDSGGLSSMSSQPTGPSGFQMGLQVASLAVSIFQAYTAYKQSNEQIKLARESLALQKQTSLRDFESSRTGYNNDIMVRELSRFLNRGGTQGSYSGVANLVGSDGKAGGKALDEALRKSPTNSSQTGNP
jgi:hypothetical protein